MSQTNQQLSLSILGCGHLGQTLAHLWVKAGLVELGQVLNTSLASSQAAVSFIGAGEAIGCLAEMQAADIYLLACPDKVLETCCNDLAQAKVIRTGAIVFHCSGAIASSVLRPLQEQGASIASVHPIKSFAQPQQAVLSFQPTYCGVEGDAAALDVLEVLFERIGGISFKIEAQQKTIYHAASVVACNYLVALQSISLRAFAQAGVEQALALKILQPIVHDTVANIFKLGPVAALTGPIARGDAEVVAKQFTALQAALPFEAEIYRLLGLEALNLAQQKNKTPAEYLQQVAQVLAGSSTGID